jgi:alpha-methylacyl-CoA racemase
VPQPAPAPRFSRTPGGIGRPASKAGADTREALQGWGFSAAEFEALEGDAVVVQS